MSTEKDLILKMIDDVVLPMGILKPIIGVAAVSVNILAQLTIAKQIPMLQVYLASLNKVPLVGYVITLMERLPPVVVDLVAYWTARLSRYLYKLLDLLLTIVLAALLIARSVTTGKYLRLIAPIVVLVMIALERGILPAFGLKNTLLKFNSLIVTALILLQLII